MTTTFNELIGYASTKIANIVVHNMLSLFYFNVLYSSALMLFFSGGGGVRKGTRLVNTLIQQSLKVLLPNME